MKINKIGIPNALLCEYYISFWKSFFEELGFQVVTSGSTTKTVLDKGVRKLAPEMCIPMKIYTGHVIELLESCVDYIYVPRFVSIAENDAFCPKFMGLPDLLVSILPDLKDKIITHSIISDSEDITTESNYIYLAEKFNIDKRKIREALKIAREKWLTYRNLCTTHGYNSREANNKVLYNKERAVKCRDLKLGVVGYVYDIYDEFISMNILEKLSELGASSVTFEMLSDNAINKQLKRFDKQMFWTFSNRTIASAYHFFEDNEIDGVIHVTAFGCGPDAFIGKYLELDSASYAKPFMTLRVDEHTGENHLQTRLEAFIDMLRRLKSEEAA